MHEQVHCRDEAANHQLPIAATFWIIRAVSMEECSNLTQKLMQICCCSHSVILNATATQYTWSLRCLLPPLTSTVKWSLFTHAHSSSLSLAARLHWCHMDCSHNINNGWSFCGQTLVHIYICNGILFNHKKRWNTSCINMDRSWEYHANQNVSHKKLRTTYDFTYMWDTPPKATNEQTVKINKNS